MITYIEIDGFKTFKSFKMSFTPLTVIAGANASGKSNLFDALQLLSRLAETDLKTAFNEQRGDAIELFTQYGEGDYADEISFVVEMLVDKHIKDNWGGEGQLKCTRLRYELKIARRREVNELDNLYVVSEKLEPINRKDDLWIKEQKDNLEFWVPKKIGRSSPYIYPDQKDNNVIIKISQDGRDNARVQEIRANILTQTVLSGITKVNYIHAFAAKEEMKSWKFLQLNTEIMRQPSQKNPGIKDKIAQNGANLAATVFRIQQEDPYILKEISRKLNKLLPNLIEVKVLNDKANNQFVVKILSVDEREFTSRVLSEGTLRLLTLCIFQYDPKHTGLLCFEEPENGIYPTSIDVLAELLKDLTIDFKDEEMPLRQLVINTHSPLLVGEILKGEDSYVSVLLSRFNTLKTSIKGKNVKLQITKMSPVEINKDTRQTKLFSDQDIKYIRQEAIRFLKTGNFEDPKKTLQS